MSLTDYKLRASLNKGLHLPSTTEKPSSAGGAKRKWEAIRARPPPTAPRTRSQKKVPTRFEEFVLFILVLLRNSFILVLLRI
jgi:hypothetical protein